MISRRHFIGALGANALAASFTSLAQQPAKIFSIATLGSETAVGYRKRIEALRGGLRTLGYVEGSNFIFESRWADGKYERLPELASELVRLKPDVLVAFANQAAVAAKGATTTIPIVIPATGDAVDTGLVSSLARPGGNITGSTFFARELMTKRMELLRETLPRIVRVGYLMNPWVKSSLPTLRALEIAAKALRLEVRPFETDNPGQFNGAFAAMMQARIDAIVMHEQPIFIVNAQAIAGLVAKHRLPSCGFNEFAEAGGLIGYGVDLLERYHHAAYFIDKIFKGTKPSDIPIEQPTKFELVANQRTAKALGIRIPQSILVRADRVIE
jgi:putative ABC transport system substrate-binding protein